MFSIDLHVSYSSECGGTDPHVCNCTSTAIGRLVDVGCALVDGSVCFCCHCSLSPLVRYDCRYAGGHLQKKTQKIEVGGIYSPFLFTSILLHTQVCMQLVCIAPAPEVTKRIVVSVAVHSGLLIELYPCVLA